MSATTTATEIVPHFIAGRRVPVESTQLLPLIAPATGDGIGLLHPAGPDTVDTAVREAAKAFDEWGSTPVKERVQPLFRFRQLVEDHLAELGALVSRENGKTVDEAIAGIRRGLEVVEYACSLPQILTGSLLEVSPGVDCHVRRLPLGVVGGITPFNFPAMVPMWMFPLAIACGNTFLLKPSEQAALTPLRLGELLHDAGLPAGVFNVLQGDRQTVEALLDHPGIRAMAFVGSTPAARAVYLRGIQSGKRMLTLGGAKNHLIVVPDADPALTARNVAGSATGCAGQRCMAASVLIAVGPCDAVLDTIELEMARIRTGTDMGPVISARARDRILHYIGKAQQDGARLRLDGRRVSVPGREAGFWIGPTLIDDVTPDSPCARDEIFGPVLTILRVATLDEAIAIENSSPYGNAASIFTTSAAVARHFETRVRAGMVGINIGVPVPREPFSFGGWNDSRFGIGDVTGTDGLSFWTQSRKTTTKWTARQSNWMS